MEFNAEVARGIVRKAGNKTVNLGDVCAHIEREAAKGLYHAYVRQLNPTEIYFLRLRGFTVIEWADSGNVFSTLITWTQEGEQNG